jgi:predicted AlkP superfamily phosphohydrolase/phosphomutase
MVIGLDCAPPALVFDHLRPRLPCLSALASRGAFGALRSVVPPITVPAWTCMVSGRDPGELGLYGFRNRAEGSYALSMDAARAIEVPRIWDVASTAEKRVAITYVPGTSPPRAVNGAMVSCLLGESGPTTHPEELAARLEARFGPHAPDVGEVRMDDPEALLEDLYETTRRRFAIATALWREERPDLAMTVEMGTDRAHHALFHHLDPSHPAHDPSDPLVADARDYYAFVDAQVGQMIEAADDDTAILVVSDHGARAMRGGVCVNEILRREGWLTLKEEPKEPAPLTPSVVDWSKTKAWGEGGYYARVFFNVAGREPEGIVEARTLDREVEALRDVLGASDLGAAIRVDAHRPAELYRAVRGVAPELLVFFGDLDYRSLSLVGTEEIVLPRDPRRADSCNHDWDGVLVAAGAGVRARGRLDGLSLYDVGPTALSLLGVAVPDGWLGRDRSAA